MHGASATISMGEGKEQKRVQMGLCGGAGRFNLELAGSGGLVGAGDADEGIDRLLGGPRHGWSAAAPS